jgi:hypothetical protein
MAGEEEGEGYVMARIDYDVGDEVERAGPVAPEWSASMGSGPFFCVAIEDYPEQGCFAGCALGECLTVFISGTINEDDVSCGWCSRGWRKRHAGPETEAELWASKTSRDATIRVREDA